MLDPLHSHIGLWPQDSPLSWNGLFDHFKTMAPIFICDPSKIQILDSPIDFYNTLIKESQIAQNRIFISTLYIGQGTPEKTLVETLHQSLIDNPDLQLSILMDYARGTRNSEENQSSLDTLSSILSLKSSSVSHDTNIQINLFRSPHLSGLWSWMPERSREVAGVHHMKAYIFDDKLIISGANLNETYLTNRQDRYMIIEDKQLSSHIYDMLTTLSKDCPVVIPPDNSLLPTNDTNTDPTTSCKECSQNAHYPSTQTNKPKWKVSYNNDIPNCEVAPLQWLTHIAHKLAKFVLPNPDTSISIPLPQKSSLQQSSIEPTSTLLHNRVSSAVSSPLQTSAALQNSVASESGLSEEKSSLNEPDTYVVVGTQLLSEIRTDSTVTSSVLSLPTPNVRIATAYFNLAETYRAILLSRGQSIYNTYRNANLSITSQVEILTADERCNSFYGASGMAGYVTPLYEHFAQEFMYDFEEKRRSLTEQQRHVQTEKQNQSPRRRKNKFKEWCNFKCNFYRYIRPKWTFHGKGIWVDIPQSDTNDTPFTLSLIGSSNFGERSMNRDSELTFTIVTKNKELCNGLNQEWNGLTAHANVEKCDERSSPSKAKKAESSDGSSYLVSMLSGIVRKWM